MSEWTHETLHKTVKESDMHQSQPTLAFTRQQNMEEEEGRIEREEMPRDDDRK